LRATTHTECYRYAAQACSIIKPGHEYYSRHFTKCRYKKIGEQCQYNCKNEMNE